MDERKEKTKRRNRTRRESERGGFDSNRLQLLNAMAGGKTLSLYCLPSLDSSFQRRQKAIRRIIFPTKKQRPNWRRLCINVTLQKHFNRKTDDSVFILHLNFEINLECMEWNFKNEIQPETANITQEQENIKNEFSSWLLHRPIVVKDRRWASVLRAWIIM